jgi:hypothetical protein
LRALAVVLAASRETRWLRLRIEAFEHVVIGDQITTEDRAMERILLELFTCTYE